MMKNKEDQWLHQMMQAHRKALDTTIKQRHDDFTSNVMKQLPREKSIVMKILETKLIWNGLLYVCLVALIGIFLIHDYAWLSNPISRLREVLNTLLQVNPQDGLSLNKGLKLLVSIPWLKLIVLVSVVSVALFEWNNPWSMERDNNLY